MAKKPKGNLLESLLRYEIVLALFALIGVYYFLTFSPVRMPRQTITSPNIELPSPSPATNKNPVAETDKNTETQAAPPASTPAQKNHLTSTTKLPEPTPRHPKVKVVKKESPTPSVIPPIKEKAAAPTPREPEATTAGSNNRAAARQKTAPERQRPSAAKSMGSQTVQSSTTTAPATAGQEPTMARPSTTKQLAAGHGKKSYVIQAGIFIFPETLKHCQQLLQDHGYTSFVTTRKKLLPMYRVFLGPYPSMKAARAIIKTITKWGDDPFPCRRGNKFYVNIGSFYYQTTAREKINQYRSRKFAPIVFHEPVNVPHHILLVNGFSFNHYPRNALRSIKQLGITDAFVRNWQP